MQSILTLHVAASILSSQELSKQENHVKHAAELLVFFVEEMKEIYGIETLTYNIHKLIHLADDVKVFRNLDSVSCFPFENYLGFLKSLIRTPNKCLAQLVKCLSKIPASHILDI